MRAIANGQPSKLSKQRGCPWATVSEGWMTNRTAFFGNKAPRATTHFVQAGWLLFLPLLAVGCGGGSSTGTTFSGNTTVSVLISSTANDQLQTYSVELASLTLTEKSGVTANLVSTPIFDGFLQANGKQEPLLTASIPQGEYVSAAATVKLAGYSCAYLNTQGTLVTAYSWDAVPLTSPAVTITLPTPIDVTGSSMALSLNLIVSQSASWNPAGADCTPGIGNSSITPTFALQSINLLSQATGSASGTMVGLEGEVESIDTSTNIVTLVAAGGAFTDSNPIFAPGPVWQVHAGSGTNYQGVSGFSALAAGQPVSLDASLQPDGSLAASRIEVMDPITSNLSVLVGPVVYVSSAVPEILVDNQSSSGSVMSGGANSLSYNNTTLFQITGQFSNLKDLPFPATFTPANVLPGQELLVTSHATSIQPQPVELAASSFTLMPQTIDGTVSAISTEGGFTVYTVTLAPYDLFPALAVQPGQTTLLKNPNTVYVYADSSAQMLNTNPIAAGGVFRFYGLVFNDSGTLRMDCAQLNDGVPE